MPIGAFKLADLEGEFVDGPSHLETDVELVLERLEDGVALKLTSKHAAAPDRAIHSDLAPEEAKALRRELDDALEAD